ncbi:MAG: carboxymuconolactone decarboxylase family protein [Candidatus Methanomethylophilaceae archaeon]|nr:carboxymuconolactone decarboxylase family protein [Candidatus Methanomethylophilaceae archaeon]
MAMSLDLLGKKDPKVLQALYRYKNEILKEGELTIREKELIATAVASTLRCEKCLEFHAEAALEHGATNRQIMEAIEVAMYLTGPSAMIWSDRIDDYIDDHREEEQ